MRGTPRSAGHAIYDKLVVPGSRVGPVALGMSSASLYKIKGEPDASKTTRLDGGAIIYNYADGISVEVEPDQTVDVIWYAGTYYSTREGVTVGMAELEASTKLGKPCKSSNTAAGNTVWTYPGLQVVIEEGAVVMIRVGTWTC